MGRVLYINLLLLIMVFAVSCSETADTEPNTDSTSIIFTITNSTEQATRTAGVDAYNENRTDRFDVFFYQGETCSFYPTVVTQIVDGTTKQAKITIPNATALSLFGNSYTVYVVANCNLARSVLTNKTFTQLKELVYDSGNLNAVTFAAQTNFLMDGQINLTLTPGINNLGRVDLKRAAAKIVATLAIDNVSGQTAGVATVTLRNYISKTNIGSDVPYSGLSTEYLNVSRSLPTGQLSTPFYCYANDWEFDSQKETYLLLMIPWTDNTSHATKNLYYRIPFNYLRATGDADTHRFRIRRNYIYNLSIRVNNLGTENPDQAVDLLPNFNVLDWTTKTIQASVTNYDFLVAYERNVTMNNISSHSIGYSSNSAIQITDATAYCNEYAATGVITKRTYAVNSPEFPRLTINSANNTIDIVTLIPENYVPKVLTFTITNAAALKQYVTVTILSPKFITAQQAPTVAAGDTWLAGSNLGGGTNNPDGASGQQNFNMFTVTTSTLELSDRMPDGAPFYGVPITLGDPTEMVTTGGATLRQTKSDLNSNSIMSPKFVIASQRAISSAHIYDNAVLRCRGYQEYPFPRGTWRVPTAAELAYGNMLQTDPNSAVKGLFAAGNNSWWTAVKYYAFNFQSNTLTALGNASTTYYIRCVHDVWRDL